ncbi:uncharacterized protein ACA1_044240 [Acanthamoeba castellanii str. Neff]|uniref:Uncharacterized protein n=1 Tax=Acanthamoeba castellanii (strain ATCC 30010 / Neff) TaxID=1257118 RepID=L8HC84_ACACF|nr:uncharacterized protein ACA1_044240 [Acanthamoeba castellanii str. Neff]ELR23119.1 hypothetical protein ACA1_044240 [Acanthamoeba castellanii str. Neff]
MDEQQRFAFFASRVWRECKLGSSPNLDDYHTRELLKITECARQCGGWRLRGSRTGYDLDAKIAIHVRNLPSNRGLGILSATSRIACVMDAVDALENQ